MEQVTHAIIVSPDAKTARYLQAAIGRSDTCVSLTTGRGFEKKVRRALDAAEHPVFIIIPGNTIPGEMRILTETCENKAGLTLIWTGASPRRDDTWVMLKLLQNNGAIVCEDLATLALAATIYRQLQVFEHPFSTVSISTVDNAVMRLLESGVSDFRANQNTAASPTLKMNRAAQIVVEHGPNRLELSASPMVISGALRHLTTLCGIRQSHIPDPVLHPDAETIAMIARPPARILSETTSKRLLGAFGLQTPDEMLCDSPSKAVRFARKLNGPATLKLVRPNFQFKTSAGGVIANVSGPSEIQKAYQTLLTLAEEMGGPRALGILVCQQIETESLFWVDAKRHDTLGRIIYFGKRDATQEQPDGVLPLPCSRQQCQNATVAAFPTLPESVVMAFADAVFQFGVMCTTLGNRIGLAQIHPLAVTNRGAMMLDAVVGITDNTSPE